MFHFGSAKLKFDPLAVLDDGAAPPVATATKQAAQEPTRAAAAAAAGGDAKNPCRSADTIWPHLQSESSVTNKRPLLFSLKSKLLSNNGHLHRNK